MSVNIVKKTIQICSILSLVGCILFAIYGYQQHLFTSQEALQTYISGFGRMGALIFIVFQVVQVVIPLLPGGLGCLAGVLLFGELKGFLYNYIGICIGSILAFIISRNFGKSVLYAMFSDKMIAKYEAWTVSDNKFTRWFAIAIFFPVAPDDFLCYLAGTTRISWRKFTAIILMGKPASIALYSLGLNIVFKQIAALVH